jgi:putative methyltransferase (TIGR04325 family)
VANLHKSELSNVNNFAEAQSNSKSYQDPELVKNLGIQFQENKKTRINKIINLQSSVSEPTIRKQHLLTGFLLSLNYENMKVADVGGGNGYMRDWVYGIIENKNLNWSVFESNQIANSYSKFETDLNLNFRALDEFKSTENFDLTIFSCVLHYLNNWDEILETALNNSKNVLIMRSPIIESEDHRYYIQTNNTDIYAKSQSSWPFIMFSKVRFEKIILDKMKLGFYGVDYEETFPYEGEQLPMSTYLLQQK